MNDTPFAQTGLPEGFLNVNARELHTLLPQPTLITCPGEREDALFVTILQHGNEDTGLRVPPPSAAAPVVAVRRQRASRT
jgi:hypothetical protein